MVIDKKTLNVPRPRRSFQINKIQRKINKLVRTKKKIEIPSNPNEKVKFINSEPKV